MMTMSETVRAAMVAALKAGDKERKGTLSMLLQALEKRQKDKLGQPLTEAEEGEVVAKMAKQTRESLDSCPADRVEMIRELTGELAVVSEFMPKQMSEEEVRGVISGVLDGLGILGTATAKDKGAIMKALMPQVKGKADGKLVNQLLMAFLHENAIFESKTNSGAGHIKSV